MPHNGKNRKQMDNKDPSNIHDNSSDELRKKKKKKILKGGIRRKVAPPSNLSVITDMDVEKMLKKLRDMDDDLQQRMDKIAELSGMSPREVKRFIENPDNFPPEEWSRMQRKRDDLEKQIYSGIGIEYQKQIMKKKKKKIAKERRGKTLGARKGWIQM